MKRLALAVALAALIAGPGGATDLPLAVSDGTNTIYGVQNLIFSGGMVTGITPNATVVVGGGGGSLLPPNAALLGGTGTTFTSVVVGAGLSLSGGVLSATLSSESISASPSPCLTTSPAPITGAGTVALQSPLGVACGGLGTGSLTANAVVLGNGTSPAGVAAPGTSGFVLTSNGPASPPSFQAVPVVGGGTVTSVGLSVPGEFTVTGSPVTTSGTLAIAKSGEGANTVWAGPTTGSPAAPAFRPLACGDLPAGGCPFDTAMNWPGVPPNSAIVRKLVERNVSCPTGFSGSGGIAKEGASAATVITINQVSSGVTTARGTFTWASAGGANQTASVASSAGMTLAPGDVIEFAFPAIADTTLGDIAITLACSRV